MKSTCLILILSAIAVFGNETKKSNEKASLTAVTDGLNKFSINLFEAIASGTKNNLVLSPLSAHILLSMTAYGAKGETFDQMKKGLGLPGDDSLGRQGFQDLTNYLNNLKNVTLEVANSIYLSDKLTLKPEYKNFASSYFQSEASELDFDKIEESVGAINSWASKKTHNKIPELIDDDFIGKETMMVLLNAVYFKAGWLEEFDKTKTTNDTFFIGGKTEKNIPTMFIRRNFTYGELMEKNAKFVELPYKNTNLKMVIIVPDKMDGIGDLIKDIKHFDWKTLAKNADAYNVALFLPKFKIESTIPLEQPLQDLGMTTMFSGMADFSKISESPLSVAKVLQKAMIEVNEEGSEAAAATVGGMILQSSQNFNSKTLRIDHPFYYRIVDGSNNLILFQGVVQDPKY